MGVRFVIEESELACELAAIRRVSLQAGRGHCHSGAEAADSLASFDCLAACMGLKPLESSQTCLTHTHPHSPPTPPPSLWVNPPISTGSLVSRFTIRSLARFQAPCLLSLLLELRGAKDLKTRQKATLRWRHWWGLTTSRNSMEAYSSLACF